MRWDEYFRKRSTILSVAYQSGVLEIRFRSGQLYRYFNVPEAAFQELLQASSKGRYFHRHIRNVYPYAPA